MSKFDSWKGALDAFFNNEKVWLSFLQKVPASEKNMWGLRKINFNKSGMKLELMKECIEALGGSVIESAFIPDEKLGL